jgi:hypothetical protein
MLSLKPLRLRKFLNEEHEAHISINSKNKNTSKSDKKTYISLPNIGNFEFRYPSRPLSLLQIVNATSGIISVGVMGLYLHAISI